MSSPEKRTLLGMLTPSSNTVLEPVTSAMLAELPEASAHFSRFAVTQIGLSKDALAQFNQTEILNAATLLSHAKCEVIGWSGTSAGWLGFDMDRKLCEAIEERTGAKACTSVLAINEIFQRTDVKRFGLVSPYLDDVQSRIIANYAAEGFKCVGERHLRHEDNFSFSEVTQDQIRQMCRDVMKSPGDQRPDAITIFCTNLRGGPLVAEIEAELGIPVYDSVATVVWKSLQLAGIDTRRVKRWGRLFQEVR